ncbi:MAG: YciI family protein [Granulosicoccus sp.]
MPDWSTYKASAKQRGALALELYVTESTPISDELALKTILPEHLEYQRKLETEGKLFLAGPLSDDTGTLMEGSGLVIYRCGSLEEARVLAENDPMHAKNVRKYRLRRWLINEGSPQFSTALSSQSVKLS